MEKLMRKTGKPRRPRIAFLGLGAMGAPMAERLVLAGFPVSVWNRTPARTKPLAKRGARVGESPADAVRDSEIVVTMLSDAGALDAVLGAKSDDGLLAGLSRGALVIDMSTAGRAAAKRAAKLVERAKGRFVDAPVSGTVGPAERGQLLAMVGGSDADVRDARLVLDVLCRRVIHAGAVGQGQALKVLLNGIGAHQFVAFASMLVLGERAGLPREVLVDAFTNGAFASPSYVGKRDKVLARDFSPEFSLSLALKDATLNIELQDEVGIRLDVVRSIASVLKRAVASGLGDLDLYAVEKWFARPHRPAPPITASRAAPTSPKSPKARPGSRAKRPR
jgi:3-hydroxyisobutyrate dehydrogenase-like beta-hydroxyacid dehydrogenase